MGGWRKWVIGGALAFAAAIGVWSMYKSSALGMCHAHTRKIGEYRMGYGLKQMMNLPVEDESRQRFRKLCDQYMGECAAYLDADVVHWCRLP